MKFKKKKQPENIKQEWNIKGEKYVLEVNKMVEFGETNGWENWKGKEPEDNREYLADEIIKQLKKANKTGDIDRISKDFPPAHAPFVKYFEKIGQSIEQLHFINQEKIIFLTGTSYQKRQAYILNGDKVTKLENTIDAIGKSKRNNVFAILDNGKITTTNNWQGEIIETFKLNETNGLGVTEIIPFNDGKKVLLVTSEGICIISRKRIINTPRT